ncbi:hypothetical protein [Iriri virus]|uniref:Uncharacterized protein n=1 Tax=Iriri virus TaxID=1620893 RepID=A0A0D3R116_9RHAB|nr:hypothetical protein [Iriri virus]AJR28379.1 hypothetical protein [Iriri virus]
MKKTMGAKGRLACIFIGMVFFSYLRESDQQGFTYIKRTCGDKMMRVIPCNLMDSVKTLTGPKGKCLVFCSSKRKIKGRDGKQRDLCLTGDPRSDEVMKCKDKISGTKSP